MMADRKLPQSLITNPTLDRWVKFDNNRTVRVATGKVEIGQGIVTALHQIAAEELDIAPARVRILSGSTEEGPDELYTSSSLSIMVSGASIRLACAEVRQKLTEHAALRLNCSPDDLSIQDGAFVDASGDATGLDYWDIAPSVDLSVAPTGAAKPKSSRDYSIVGQSQQRLDLPAKVNGGGFIQDLRFPDMVHARVLRQPNKGAVLASLDEAALRKISGDPALRIVRRANFVAFISSMEHAADRAVEAATASAVWSNVQNIDPASQEGTWLVGRPSIDRTIGDPDEPASSGEIVERTYSRPYIAHASLGPSCALARFQDGRLTVWSHGQGMHPLRRNIASVLSLPEDAVTCHHADGAGCYGHNGADDAALDAAIIALELPGETVRLQWRREDECRFEPLSTAMAVTLRVALDSENRPIDWTTDIWSGTHVQRPGTTSGYLLAADALEEPPPAVEPTDPPEERGGGGTRNAVPLYDVGRHRIHHHLIRSMPVRTSALRGLGAITNIFALEGLMDELAANAGEDPVSYRLRLLPDARGRAVIERTAAMAGWRERGAGGNGKGMGLAFARYKNVAAYAAVAVAVTVDEEVRLDHVWCAADAGLVINPDGTRNQLEGGIIQGASFALKEKTLLGGDGVQSRDWDTYPILRFSEVPPVETELIIDPDAPALGVGECTVGPVAAAIGNAVAHALGKRIYDMPLDREQILAGLLKSDTA